MHRPDGQVQLAGGRRPEPQDDGGAPPLSAGTCGVDRVLGQVGRERLLLDAWDRAARAGARREEGRAVVLPTGCARDGESVLLHGSAGGGLLREAAAGAPVTVTVTPLDGLVVARSLLDGSTDHRGVMTTGAARTLSGQERTDALPHLSEHLLPGRGAEVRTAAQRFAR